MYHCVGPPNRPPICIQGCMNGILLLANIINTVENHSYVTNFKLHFHPDGVQGT